jgi:hypothetical protein
MGKGLAAHFKNSYPDMFRRYRELCQSGQLDIGKLWLWKASDQWILSFPTKKHWRAPSRLEYIERGLQKFVAYYEQKGIREVSFPRLGCGNGGLDWEEVRPLMEHYLRPLPISVYIHDYTADVGLPEHLEIKDAALADRSFSAFRNSIITVLTRMQGQFKTYAKKTPFTALPDTDGGIRITRSGRTTKVQEEEIKELWTFLIRGTVTRDQLPGNLRESAYYIFPILFHIPHVRPVEVASMDDVASMGVELVESHFKIYDMQSDSDIGEGEFEWH